jgi:hypothetical protein
VARDAGPKGEEWPEFNDEDWEKILRHRIEAGEAPPAAGDAAADAEVRLSELRLSEGAAGEKAGAPSATEGALGELRARLEETERARYTADARVQYLEQELERLRSGSARRDAPPVGASAAADEVEELRRALREAHEIIRAIEEAYREGGGG